jgi:hypothetical protein
LEKGGADSSKVIGDAEVLLWKDSILISAARLSTSRNLKNTIHEIALISFVLVSGVLWIVYPNSILQKQHETADAFTAHKAVRE